MKLPKHIAIMVEKGNLVSAIKNLANEQDISMGEAKVHIDNHEASLKDKQQKQQDKIINKQVKTENNSSTDRLPKLAIVMKKMVQKIIK